MKNKMKNKNKKQNEKKIQEDFISNYFAWIDLEEQKKRAEELNNIKTKK